MNLHILASGSSGNCTCLEHKERYIFIDAGVPFSKIKGPLGNIRERAKEISIFITHEHHDHISGLMPFVKGFSPNVYSSAKTADILASAGIDQEKLFVLDAGVCYDFHDYAVTPFDITHDAAEPFGYKFDIDGSTFSIATDLGTVTEYLLKALEGTQTIMLESNYEDEILKHCSYPAVLKSRIASMWGHLSNKDAFNAVGELSKSGLKKCFFSHVSENGNSYELLDKYAQNCKECYMVETSAIRRGSYVHATI